MNAAPHTQDTPQHRQHRSAGVLLRPLKAAMEASRDLKWRYRQLPPRLRLLVRWSAGLCVQCLLWIPASVMLREAVGLIPRSSWPELLLRIVLSVLLNAAAAVFIGLWTARRPPVPTGAYISASHDTRWNRLYPRLLLGAFFISIVSTLVIYGLDPRQILLGIAGLFPTYVGMQFTACGTTYLKVLLRELPPPRTRQARQPWKLKLPTFAPPPSFGRQLAPVSRQTRPSTTP